MRAGEWDKGTRAYKEEWLRMGDEARGAACVVCLDAVGADGVLGNCGRACASHTAYHARCHAEMRSRCRLECAVCRHRSTVADGARASPAEAEDDDHGWLMFDYAGALDGTARMGLVMLVAFVLSPPLLLARMLWLRMAG